MGEYALYISKSDTIKDKKMKKFYAALFIAFLIIGCSNDDPINEVIEEEIVNHPPNNFVVEIMNITHEGATINWTEAIDPERDVVTYTIYLNQKLIIENISELTYKVIGLEELTNHSGKIIAKDINNNKTETTFSFQTEKYYLKYLKRFDFGKVDHISTGYAGGTPYSMIKTNDLKYIVAGKSSRQDANGNQFFVSKIDYEGNEIWKKYYDYQVGDSWLFKIANTSSGFILAGNQHVLNLDHDGNVIWYKKIESYDLGYYDDQISSVKQDSKGNLFLVGSRGSTDGKVFKEAVLTKLSSTGNIIWEKKFSFSVRNIFNDLVINSFNELIILGSTDTSGTTYEEILSGSNPVQQIDFWLLKLTNDGEIIWETTFGDVKLDFPTQLIATTDNCFVAVGYGGSLFKIDNSGKVVWRNTEPSAYIPTFSVAETKDNGFVTTGSFEFETFDALAISKYDSSGNLEWEKSYHEQDASIWGFVILSEDDGGYRIAGRWTKPYYYNDEKPNLLIFKTDPSGNHE